MADLELLVYAFLVGAFLLFNWVSRRAKRQRLERQRIALEKFRQQPGGLDAGNFGRAEPVGRPGPVAPREPLERPSLVRPAPVSRPEAAYRGSDPLSADWGRVPESPSYETLSSEVPAQFKEEKLAAPPRRTPAAATPAPKNAPRQPQPHRILRTRRDLREAVVAMTVLGPCRALQPYDTPVPEPAAASGRPVS